LIIGNANSANDIAAHIAKVCNPPVFRAARYPALPGFPSLADERIEDVAAPSKFTIQDDNRVAATLTDGRIINDIDHVEVGTGYRPFPDIVRVLRPNTGPRSIMRSNLSHIPDLHRLLLYSYNPSLAFIGMYLSFTPFVLADVASLWVGLVWSRQLSIPKTAEELLVSEQQRLKQIADLREKHQSNSSFLVYSVLGLTEDDYACGLRRDIVQVRPEYEDLIQCRWNGDMLKGREDMFVLKRKALEWARDHPR